ncbi:MAG: uncharacterized protein PWP34_1846 [Desulfuromonadales bacterium]|jgi:aminoglycoside phosphotransferase family enzyme/predicted kinase|nr:uncharacterized protein [Desulfuromonadales bacterium]
MDSQTLHKTLLNPRTYQMPEADISFKETHISRLYFVGDRVYKIKKPVDFGFLDFTTLEKRLFYCQEEVRLNKRFCDGVYLGVADIREHEGQISLDGPGHTIEHAVVMKRLPEAGMLPQLLTRNDPALPDRMALLARHIAERYLQLESFGPETDTPHLEVVKNNWEENFSQTEPFIGRTISSETFAVLQNYVRGFEKDHAELFRKREARGWVRDGHGDLHCEHICFIDHDIAIYDCIEFNRRFRIADVLADLAFLLMDLELRGRHDLAATVRKNYFTIIEENEDTGLLLPFYQVYRAYVRGKVESFLSDDPNADHANRKAAEDRARKYFNQALGYLCRSPKIILTCGLMGVGKTTISRNLAIPLAAKLLRSDEVRKELAGISPRERCEEDFGAGIYSENSSRSTYELLLSRALSTLQSGRSVIIDASFADRQERRRFQAAATKAGFPLWTVLVTCDRETVLQRLDRRHAQGEDASDGRCELYDRQAQAFDPVEEHPGLLHADGSEDTPATIARLLASMLNEA